MNFGAIIIGDEILSGKRQDKHLTKTIELLGARGLQLAWCHYLGDDAEPAGSAVDRGAEAAEVVALEGAGAEQCGTRHEGGDFEVFGGDDFGELVGHACGKGNAAPEK